MAGLLNQLTGGNLGSTVGSTGIAGQTLANASYGAGTQSALQQAAGAIGNAALAGGKFLKDVGQQRLSSATGGLIQGPSVDISSNPIVGALQQRILARAGGGGGGPTGGASGGPDRGSPVQGGNGEDDGIGALLRQIQEAIGSQ